MRTIVREIRQEVTDGSGEFAVEDEAFFSFLLAIPRTAGWLAHWQEHILDPEQKTARQRQVYLGRRGRTWQSIDKR